jgi:hypothetical protein
MGNLRQTILGEDASRGAQVWLEHPDMLGMIVSRIHMGHINILNMVIVIVSSWHSRRNGRRS